MTGTRTIRQERTSPTEVSLLRLEDGGVIITVLTGLDLKDTDGFEIDTAPGNECELERSTDGGANWVSTGIRMVGDGASMVLFEPAGLSSANLSGVVNLSP